MKKYREIPRKHGFERPFNLFQIMSWILFGLNILIYALIIIPAFPFSAKFAFIITFFAFCSFTAYFGYKATRVDPTDSTVYEERSFLKRNLEYPTELKQFCTVCNTHVKPRTKHCGQCNRCAEIFDHHCKWLNNCVGSKNYRWFILLILALFILMIIKTSSTIYNITLYNHSYETFEDDIHRFYNLSVKSEQIALLFYILIIIFFLQDPIIIFLLLDLIVLHIFLKFKKMTTYEFIVLQRTTKEKNKINVNSHSQNDRPKPIIKIESQGDINNKFLNPNNLIYVNQKELKPYKLIESAVSKKNSALTNQSSFKESKKTIDFTNSVLEECKRNDDPKKSALTKWNSNSTTPQNFVNEIEDFREYSNHSSIFADIETRALELNKPLKSQQPMMFKKKLNNVILRAKSYNTIPELQEAGDPVTHLPHKKPKDSINTNMETCNVLNETAQNRDESTLDILICKKNETSPNILLQEENGVSHLPNIVQEEENRFQANGE